MTVTSSSQSRATRRKVLLAGNCGNFVEWFDFAIYGYLAPVLAGLFFPAGDRTTQLLSVFAVFAVSFAARPIGAMVFGPLGDRIGRRRTLALVVLLMSGATCAIGLLPTYGVIGVAAPLLLVLCRIAQGFSAGGEYAGASIFLVEHAPPRRRGFYASFIPLSSYAAFLAAVALVTGLTVALPEAAMQSWGWRVPFLLAGIFGVVGLFIRSRVADTPAFKAVEAAGAVPRRPLRDTLRTQWKPLLVIFGIVVTDSVYYYMIWTYMPTYLSEEVGMKYEDALLANSLALTVLLIVVPLAGILSDRIGRKPMLLAAFIGFAVLTLPAFWVAGHGTIGLAIVGQLVFLVPAFLLDTPMSAALAEAFPAEVRYSSGALAYNIGYIVGGAAPFVSTLLIASTGQVLAPAFYIVALAVGSTFVVAFGFKESYRRRLSPAEPDPAADGAVAP